MYCFKSDLSFSFSEYSFIFFHISVFVFFFLLHMKLSVLGLGAEARVSHQSAQRMSGPVDPGTVVAHTGGGS